MPTWIFVSPEAARVASEAGKGDVAFAPQGHFHSFANASDSEDLAVRIVFNSSSPEPGDDTGDVHTLSALPPKVLGAVFGTGPAVWQGLPEKLGRVVIASTRNG